MQKDVFCADLVKKYGKPGDMPAWVLMELFSFGSFVDLYLYCAERWNDEEIRHEHYMLRQAKSVRNACAHSSAILNGIAASDSAVNADAAVMRALAEAGLSHRVRTAKMRNPRIGQITTLMYLHGRIVPTGSGRRRAIREMGALEARMSEVSAMLVGNDAVRSSLGFLAKLIDSWFQ